MFSVAGLQCCCGLQVWFGVKTPMAAEGIGDWLVILEPQRLPELLYRRIDYIRQLFGNRWMQDDCGRKYRCITGLQPTILTNYIYIHMMYIHMIYVVHFQVWRVFLQHLPPLGKGVAERHVEPRSQKGLAVSWGFQNHQQKLPACKRGILWAFWILLGVWCFPKDISGVAYLGS